MSRRALTGVLALLSLAACAQCFSPPVAPLNTVLGARGGVCGAHAARLSAPPLLIRRPCLLSGPAGTVLSLASGGGGSGSGGSSGGGGGGGGGGEEGKDEDHDNFQDMIARYGLEESSLPVDLVKAIKDGRATSEALKRYVDLMSQWWLAPFMAIKLFRQRLLADNTFVNKVAIEMIMGGVSQTLAERAQRGENFKKEMDFVVAGVLTCVFGNFFAVYLSAPTLIPHAKKATTNAIKQFLSSCPDNAFQTVLKGTAAPTLLQRCGGIIKPMPELFVVGFVAASGGYIYTTLSIAARKAMNPKMKGGAEVSTGQIAQIATAVGFYVALSSNLRYQFMSGVLEQRLIDVAFKNYVSVRTACSAVMRTGNTYLGSYLLVSTLKFLGLQKMSE